MFINYYSHSKDVHHILKSIAAEIMRGTKIWQYAEYGRTPYFGDNLTLLLGYKITINFVGNRGMTYQINKN